MKLLHAITLSSALILPQVTHGNEVADFCKKAAAYGESVYGMQEIGYKKTMLLQGVNDNDNLYPKAKIVMKKIINYTFTAKYKSKLEAFNGTYSYCKISLTEN